MHKKCYTMQEERDNFKEELEEEKGNWKRKKMKCKRSAIK